jgi:2-haloacid dehalogenase
VTSRWATFDCYGTLIDWDGGTRAALRDVFGDDSAFDRYHELEREIQREDPGLSYREVATEAMRRLGASDEDAPRLPDSLPSWRPFPEVPGSLEDVRAHGWKIAILSNSDPPQIEASKARIGVPFDETVVAGAIGSYKPAHRHWEEFWARTGADRARHVHVGASLYHDAEPAHELGLPFVWINRLGESSELPTRELRDLTGLAEALDELVPA